MLSYNQTQFNKPRFKYNNRIKFGSKQYSNPFFKRKKNKTKLSASFVPFYAKIIVVILAIAVAASGWFLLYSGYFNIKNIEIKNEGRISIETINALINEQMASNLLVFLPQKNIWLFNKEELEKRLEAKYSFEKIQIIKNLPNKLSVVLTEKQYALIWHEDDKYYYADNSGEIISETSVLDIKDKNYPLIDNLSSKKIDGNKTQIAQEDIDFVNNLFIKLQDYKNEFKVLSYIYDNDVNTIKANIENGPKIFFNTQGNMDKQLEKAMLIKRDQLKNDFFKKEYINVRIEDRVYYK